MHPSGPRSIDRSIHRCALAFMQAGIAIAIAFAIAKQRFSSHPEAEARRHQLDAERQQGDGSEGQGGAPASPRAL